MRPAQRPSNGETPDRIRLVAAARPDTRAAAARVVGDLARVWPGCEVALVEARPEAGTGHAATASAVRRALRDGRADAAVHVVRDLPHDAATDLTVVAVPMRDDPRDVFLARSGKVLQYASEGARIGTIEPRQQAQLLRRRSDLGVVELDDDPDAALERFDAGDMDGLVLRAEDVVRLALIDRVTEYFDPDVMIPGPGQGAVALEARAGDVRVAQWLSRLHDPDTAYAVLAERTCAATLGAGRRAAVGVYALTDGSTMFIHGIVATPDGSRAARLRWSGPTRDAEEVGDTLAELLASVGARDILAGGPLPPSIRYAERRRDLIEGWDDAPTAE